jgi:hypothetical protein
VIFYLRAFALERTSPTKTAATITVNPIFAADVGALAIGEPKSGILGSALRQPALGDHDVLARQHMTGGEQLIL